MKFTQLFDERRAVSPVIGVILMVAITVILAAVIGTFVLGLSDQVGSDTPRASFGFDYDDPNDQVVVTHESGDTIDSANLEVIGAGGATWPSGDVTAGDSTTVSSVTGGETLRVVYSSPDSDSTTTLQKFEVPS